MGAQLVGAGGGRETFSDIWPSLGSLGCGSRMKGCCIHRCSSQMEMGLVVGGGRWRGKKEAMAGSEVPLTLVFILGPTGQGSLFPLAFLLGDGQG